MIDPQDRLFLQQLLMADQPAVDVDDFAEKSVAGKFKGIATGGFGRMVDLLSRGTYASAEFAKPVLRNVRYGQAESERRFGPMEEQLKAVPLNVLRGIQGKEKTTYGGIIREELGGNKAAQILLGTPADILLAPDTWLTFGFGAVPKIAGKFGMAGKQIRLSKKGTEFVRQFDPEFLTAKTAAKGSAKINAVAQEALEEAIASGVPGLVDRGGLKFAGTTLVSGEAIKKVTDPVKYSVKSMTPEPVAKMLGDTAELLERAFGKAIAKVPLMKQYSQQYTDNIAAEMERIREDLVTTFKSAPEAKRKAVPDIIDAMEQNAQVDDVLTAVMEGKSAKAILEEGNVTNRGLRGLLKGQVKGWKPDFLEELDALRKTVDLSDEQISNMVVKSQQVMADIAKLEQEAGLLGTTLRDYVTHVYTDTRKAKLAYGMLRRNLMPVNKYAKPRSLPTMGEARAWAKAHGMTLEDDIAKILAVRAAYSAKMLAGKNLIEKVRATFGVAEVITDLQYKPLFGAAIRALDDEIGFHRDVAVLTRDAMRLNVGKDAGVLLRVRDITKSFKAKAGRIVQRIEEPGAKPDFSKPQGLYTTPGNVKSPHNLGGTKSRWEVDPSAKIVDIASYPGAEMVMRKGAVDAGAGVHAARKLLGDELFFALKGMTKSALVSWGKTRYPSVDFSRYYDTQEIMEAIGGMEARAKGYDGFSVRSQSPEFDEIVLLNAKAAKPVEQVSRIDAVRDDLETFIDSAHEARLMALAKNELKRAPHVAQNVLKNIDAIRAHREVVKSTVGSAEYDKWLVEQYRRWTQMGAQDLEQALTGLTLKDFNELVPTEEVMRKIKNPALAGETLELAGSTWKTSDLVPYSPGHGAANPFKGYLLPKPVVEEFHRLSTSYPGSDVATAQFLKLFDTAQGSWMRFVTLGFIDFHTRNAGTNVIFNFLDIGMAAFDPRKRIMGMKLAVLHDPTHPAAKLLSRIGFKPNASEEITTALGQKITLGEAVKTMEDNGVFQVGLLGASTPQGFAERVSSDIKGIWNWQSANPVSPNFLPFRLGAKVGAGVEAEARALNWLVNFERTGDGFQAAERTRKFMIDYHTGLTPFEQTWMRRMIPFYTFFKQNMILQAEQLIKQPGKQMVWPKLANEMAAAAGVTGDEVDLLPDYVTEKLAIVWGRNADGTLRLISGNILPIEDLARLLSRPDRAAQTLPARGTPFVMRPLEFFANYSFFTQQAIDDPTTQNYYRRAWGALDDVPGLRDWLKLEKTRYQLPDGSERVIYNADPTRMWMLQNVTGRLLSVAQKIGRPFVAVEKGGEGKGVSGLAQGAIESTLPGHPFDITPTKRVLPMDLTEQKVQSEAGGELERIATGFIAGSRGDPNGLTGRDWREARSDILQQKAAKLELLQEQSLARENLSKEELSKLESGRLRIMGMEQAAVTRFQSIQPEQFQDEFGQTNWDEYRKAKEEFLAELDPSTRAYVEANRYNYLKKLPASAQRIETAYIRAQKVLEPYWDVRRRILAANPALAKLDAKARVDERLARHPALVTLERRVRTVRERMRRNPEINSALKMFY